MSKMSTQAELQQLQSLQISNLKYAVSSLTAAFSDPRKVARARSYVERQALQSVHRAIEIKRGEQV